MSARFCQLICLVLSCLVSYHVVSLMLCVGVLPVNETSLTLVSSVELISLFRIVALFASRQSEKDMLAHVKKCIALITADTNNALMKSKM